MKSKNQNPFLVAVITLAGFAFTASSAFAAELAWDADNLTAGAQDGAGTWATAAGNWRNTTSTTDNQNWVNANLDKAAFGAGTDGTYAITLSGTPQAGGGIAFNNSGYALSGSALSLVNGLLDGPSPWPLARPPPSIPPSPTPTTRLPPLP